MRMFFTKGATHLALVLTTMAGASIAAGLFQEAAQQSSSEQPDKYTWLEDIHGEKPMAWVMSENARTAAVLEKDSHFAPLEADALKVLDSPERLAWPSFRDGKVYNFWQDAEHARNPPAHDAQGLSDGRAALGDGAGHRCTGQRGQAELGGQGEHMPAA